LTQVKSKPQKGLNRKPEARLFEKPGFFSAENL
jgi:hypothetical protein